MSIKEGQNINLHVQQTKEDDKGCLLIKLRWIRIFKIRIIIIKLCFVFVKMEEK